MKPRSEIVVYLSPVSRCGFFARIIIISRVRLNLTSPSNQLLSYTAEETFELWKIDVKGVSYLLLAKTHVFHYLISKDAHHNNLN